MRLIVVGSPGCVDADTFRNSPEAAAMYNKTLSALRDIAREVAQEEGAVFANVFDPMHDTMTKAKAKYILTTDGRSLFGLIVEATPKAVTLVDGKNEKVVVPRDKIDEMSASPVSLMPEKQLDTFDDQMLRDFFAYLQSAGPVGEKPK